MPKPFWTSVILVFLLLGNGVSCQSWNAGTATPPREVSEIITQGAPQSARAYEQRAYEAARRWRPDAYLLGAHITIPAKRPDGGFTREAAVSFNFMSKADENHWYTMDFDSGGTLGDYAGIRVTPPE